MSDCVLWTGKISTKGYGLVWMGKPRVYRLAHRLAYQRERGEIPTGLQLDHTCHNADPSCAGGLTCLHRRCVNVEHLEAVTRRENILRGKNHIAGNARKRTCSKGHPYTQVTLADGETFRRCMTCVKEQRKARYWREKPTRKPWRRPAAAHRPEVKK